MNAYGGPLSSNEARPIATVTIGDFIFDLNQFQGRAKALLETVQLLNDSLSLTRTLRTDNGDRLDVASRRWVDEVAIPHAVRALAGVSNMVQGSQVNRSSSPGMQGPRPKTMFLIYDGPQLMESTALLDTAYSGLISAISLLRSVSQSAQYPPRTPSTDGSRSNASSNSGRGYGESQFLRWRRQSSQESRIPIGCRQTKYTASNNIQPTVSEHGPVQPASRYAESTHSSLYTTNSQPDQPTQSDIHPAFRYAESTHSSLYSSHSQPDPLPQTQTTINTIDSRPVYTGTDSFILIADTPHNDPAAPSITLNAPASITSKASSEHERPFVEYEVDTLPQISLPPPPFQQQDTSLPPFQQHSSPPPLFQPPAPPLSFEHIGPPRRTDTYNMDSSVTLVQSEDDKWQAVRLQKLKSPSTHSLPSYSTESRGRAFLKRAAGIPEA